MCIFMIYVWSSQFELNNGSRAIAIQETLLEDFAPSPRKGLSSPALER
jgi:hypothetical protein